MYIPFTGRSIARIKELILAYINSLNLSLANTANYKTFCTTVCNFNHFIELWNKDDYSIVVKDGGKIALNFEINSKDYFSFYLSSYNENIYRIIYYNGTWTKARKILESSVDDNNKNSLTLSGNLTVNGTINGTASSAGVNIGNFNITQNIIQKNSSDSYLELKGDIDDSTGARLILFSTGYSADSNRSGSFELISKSINSQYRLQGRPDGTLYWNGNDLAGSAIVAKSLGTNGYIKYASGLIMQWGRALIAISSTQITFPVSFSNTNYIIICTPYRESGEMPVVVTRDYATGLCYGQASIETYIRWLAIGY